MSDERFLITGALGCIGAWSCAQLVREAVPVILYDVKSRGAEAYLALAREMLERTAADAA